MRRRSMITTATPHSDNYGSLSTAFGADVLNDGEKGEAILRRIRERRLKGPLAFEMITSDDLWRYVLEFLGPEKEVEYNNDDDDANDDDEHDEFHIEFYEP